MYLKITYFAFLNFKNGTYFGFYCMFKHNFNN